MAAALVVLGVAVQQYYRVTLKLRDPLGGHINDFDRWMLMTPAFVRDGADYVNDLLPTPPISLIALAPFTALSRPTAQFAWVCLKLPLALLVFVDMQEGQTNFLALAPLVAGLYVAQRETRRAEIAAGLLIGFASAMKVTPAVFAVYFAWRRRWAVAAAAAAGGAASLLVVPALVFGWSQNLRWLGQWGRIMILPYLVRGTVVYATSQSVGSFALRFFSAVPAFETSRAGLSEPHYMNLFAFSPGAVFAAVRAVMVGVGIAGLIWMRRPLPTLQCRRYLVEVGAAAAFMLWFSERTWVHHYVSFILTLAAAGATMSDPAESEARRRLVRAALVLFAAATLLASEAGRVLGANGVDWAKGAGVFLWPSVILTVAVTCRWRRVERRASIAGALPVFRYANRESSLGVIGD